MTGTTARRGVAARAADVWKVYGSGEAQVVALRGVSVELERGPVHRDHGPVRVRQVDADALPGRAGHGHPRRGLHRRHQGRPGSATTALTELRRDKVGFIFQQFNLLPTLTAEENILLPLAIAGRKPDPAVVRHGHRHGRPARPARPPADPALRRPAAAGRVRPRAGRPARGDLRRRADRQPRLPLRRRGARLPARLGPRASARPSSWSPTTRTPPSYADRVIFLADGADRRRADRADRRDGAGHDEAPRRRVAAEAAR